MSSPMPTTAGMPRDALHQEQIVLAAIAVSDEGGIESLTMRRLGSRLGITAAALYWHVGSPRPRQGEPGRRHDVLLLAADAVWGQTPLPALDGLDWRPALLAMADNLRSMLLRHPWLLAGRRLARTPLQRRRNTGRRLSRLTIRALGRGTRRLYTDLSEGHPAILKGPYGIFDHTVGGPRQIWFGGGTGIAPFLGWLAHPGAAPPRTDLFHCVPTAEDAPFLPELTAAAAHRPEFRLHPTFSRSHGRLTAERIQAQAGPITP